MRDTLDMAREANLAKYGNGLREGVDAFIDALKDFEALVRADEREEFQRWFVGVITQHEQLILAEREACAKVCEQGVDTEHPTVKGHIMKNFGASTHLAKAIRARSEA